MKVHRFQPGNLIFRNNLIGMIISNISDEDFEKFFGCDYNYTCAYDVFWLESGVIGPVFEYEIDMVEI